MSAIGYVTKKEDGSYSGNISTMSVKTPISIVPNKSKEHEKQPDFRVFARGAEVGAAWNRKGKVSGKSYVSVCLTAPEFGERKIYANLGPAAGQDDPDVHALIWNQ